MARDCSICGKLFSSDGTKDKDGNLIMFMGCEHLTSRNAYNVVPVELPVNQSDLRKLKLKAIKENKSLWLQLKPSDFKSNPEKPEDVSKGDIKYSTRPYFIADVVTVVFDDKVEMRIHSRYIMDKPTLVQLDEVQELQMRMVNATMHLQEFVRCFDAELIGHIYEGHGLGKQFLTQLKDDAQILTGTLRKGR